MGIKLDENLPAGLADELRQLGHDVDATPDEDRLMQVKDDPGFFVIPYGIDGQEGGRAFCPVARRL